MILGAVLLIVALATSDAAPNREYDLADCRTQKVANRTHHAENPDDCRTFYNCDNAHGGKLTYCPAGTIYDSDIGVCTTKGDCRVWYEKSNCQFNPQGMGKFPWRCCNSYYEYDCASRGFTFVICPENQYFMPNGASDGACGFTEPSGCSTTCNVLDTTCESLGLEYVGPCEFKHKNDFSSHGIMKCPAGTKMDSQTCQCVWDYDNTCTEELPAVLVKTGCGNLNAETFEYERTDGCEAVNTLWGRDLWYTAFALRMSFTLSQSFTGGSIPILTTENSACQDLQLDVSVINGNRVRVTMRDYGMQAALEGNIGNLGGNIILKIVFDVRGSQPQFVGSVNNSPLTDASGGNFQALNAWATGLDTLCLPCLDNISGKAQFSVWRDCTDLNQLN